MCEQLQSLVWISLICAGHGNTPSPQQFVGWAHEPSASRQDSCRRTDQPQQQPEPSVQLHNNIESTQRTNTVPAQHRGESPVPQPVLGAVATELGAMVTRPLNIVPDEEVAWLFAE